MAKQLLINGQDKTDLAQKFSLKIRKAINARSYMDFTLKDVAGVYRPDPGQTVQLYDGAVLIFAGLVHEPEEERLPGATPLLVNQVPVNDWHEVADRFLASETYTNTTAGAIARDLITKYLAGDGITAGNIQDGPTLTKVVFPYVTTTQALDDLSELTGFQWEINASKALNFFDRSTYRAPWDIDTASPIRNVKVKKDRSNYRNRQYLRAGKDISGPQAREFAGDSKTTTFTADLPIAEVPTLTVNGAVKTVGIRGIDTGKDWYWNKGDATLSQDTAGAVLTSADTLRIVFRGFYPLMVVAEDPAAIAERKSIEGGTGIYERIESRESIDTSTAALEYTSGLLRRYARISNILTYETENPGLEPGMIQAVVLAQHGINGDFLISEVSISDPGFQDQNLRYTVKALDGEAVGGWEQFFKKLVQNQQTFTIRENEVLTRQVMFSEAATWAESTSVTVSACPVPSLTLYPSSTLYPC